MKISEVISELTACLIDHGDVEVHAFPGWDTSYPVTSDTIEYYGGDVTKDDPYVLITGAVPESLP